MEKNAAVWSWEIKIINKLKLEDLVVVNVVFFHVGEEKHIKLLSGENRTKRSD
jgi:hypothetical protein